MLVEALQQIHSWSTHPVRHASAHAGDERHASPVAVSDHLPGHRLSRHEDARDIDLEGASKAINSISTIMNSIRIQSKVIGSVKNPNCKFTCLQVLQLLVLFPFFSIKNAANYSSSALGKMFVCHKAALLSCRL